MGRSGTVIGGVVRVHATQLLAFKLVPVGQEGQDIYDDLEVVIIHWTLDSVLRGSLFRESKGTAMGQIRVRLGE